MSEPHVVAVSPTAYCIVPPVAEPGVTNSCASPLYVKVLGVGAVTVGVPFALTVTVATWVLAVVV